jgi:hypothetical protein
MPKAYDPAHHDGLDHLLIRLLKILHAQVSPAKVGELAKKIIDDCAAQKWLVRPKWEEHWRLYKDVQGNGILFDGWFHDVPPQARGDALYDVFESIARLVMDSGTAYTARKHLVELSDRLSVYLSLRGHDLDAILEAAQEERPVEPTREFCLAVPNRIRWVGETEEADRRDRDLLGIVLDHYAAHGPKPISCCYIEEKLRSKPKTSGDPQYVSKAVSALNKHLVTLQFPWTLTTSNDYLHFERVLTHSQHP